MNLTCKHITNDEFIQNITQIEKTYVFSEMYEFNLENKLVKNFLNSNVINIFLNSLKILSLNNCTIQSINQGIFNQMPLLEYISLSRNEIDSIEVNSFLGETFQSKILESNLSNNKLKKIYFGQFNGLKKVQKLFIDNNQIEEIELNSFENLNNLIRLNMQSNKIKVIQDKLLDNKNDLTILYLYQNSIDSIETISFNTLRSLKKLHLFSNKIKTIKFGNFIHLQSVNELKLDKNEIVSFDANTFVGMESLKLLDLSANKIKKLVNRAFDGLKNVSKLELDLNDIEQIEMNAFTDLVNLNRLNLDSNQIFTLKNVQFNTNIMELFIQFNFISNFSEINASTLKSLHISNNRIQEINYATHLQRLEFLDLSQNRLISINEKSFSNLNGLKYLNLSGNRLDLESEFDNISYFKNQTILETLDLSFNLIKFFNTNKTFHFLSSLKVCF
jgi:Leucine-rich repeat (LRR) protein